MLNQPLAKHNLLKNGDIREAVNVGNTLFWQNRCLSGGGGESIGAQFNGISLGPISIAYLTFGEEVSIEPVTTDQHLIIQTTLSGNSSTKNGARKITTGASDIAVIDASLPTTITFQPGCAHLALKIDRSLIENTLQTLLQQSIREPVSFALNSVQDEVNKRAWNETMNFLCSFYDDTDSSMQQNSYLLKSHIEMVACTLVNSQKNNYTEYLENHRYTAAPRHVRRACEYVDQNINGLISMSQLCAITNVAERTLQNGFKKYLGQTPNEFIQSRRLHHIHLALQNADEKTNVSRIMWEYSVNNPGRCAKLYFERYGCYPSDTLKTRFN